MQATDRKSHNPKPYRHIIAGVKEVPPFSLILSLWIRHGKADIMYWPFFVLRLALGYPRMLPLILEAILLNK
jgi:hypothetical protein